MSRRLSPLEVNMFPFLSVLCSVIGVLMLFILAIVATRAVDVQAVTVPNLRDGNSEDSRADGSLQPEEYETLESEIEALTQTLTKRESELRELNELSLRIKRLLALKSSEFEDAGKQFVTGFDIGSSTKVELAPIGDIERIKTPQFIEVDVDGYTLHPEQRHFSIDEIPGDTSKMRELKDTTTPLQQYLARADRQREDEYLIFLIRPSGSSAFDRIRRYLVVRYPHPQVPNLSRIDAGWEPFSNEWLLLSEQSQDSPPTN